MKLELEIDVPESREVTLRLPSGTPKGRATVVLYPSPNPHDPPPTPDDKFEREKAAYYRLLPELLKTHYHKVVAIHDGQVLLVGDDPVQVTLAAYKLVGYVELFVERVEYQRRIERLRGPREIRKET
jgi:hypothetical protein